MVYSVTLEDSRSDSLSIESNEAIETPQSNSSTTSDNLWTERLTERLPETTEPCLPMGERSDSRLNSSSGRAVSLPLFYKTDILQNSLNRGPNELNVLENERRKEHNRAKSVQISDLGRNKCKSNVTKLLSFQ